MEKTIKYLENGEYHYATVRSVGDLAQLKTTSKETLVEAINELWNGGGNTDPSKAPKPEGYDQLVQDVADAVKNQQEINQQWTEWQKEDAQLTEERRQAYLQAMKEMQESVDKAKADAAALDKKLQEGVDTLNNKTAKLDEQITKTFSDLDANIQNMHEQLQREADSMNQELINTKSDLTKVRTDLQNAQLDNGKIHDELTNINGKFEHKVWQTDLDPLKEQIDRAETSVQQTKDELLGKASRQDLDTVTNTVSKLDTQLKETAKGVEISVKKDELGGEIAEALTNKTNLLLGTRNFAGDKWSNLDHWHEEPGYWNGLKVYSSTSDWYGIQYQYEVKKGNQYTFSFYARQQSENNSAYIMLSEGSTGSQRACTEPYQKSDTHIGTEWKRYSLTFQAIADGTIYPRVEQSVTNNKLYVAGYKLELGKNATPWEPNEADVAENIEHTESQFNVYSDQIAGIVKKQEKMGDTERQLDTRITETAEGLKQTSKDLQDANGKITEFKGQLESTARGLKSEYEKYTNDAVGQISDSTLNLIRNSSFQNKDEDFAQWQNISAKANIRQDENGLRWVELTQSGLTTDNPQGITSNYFNVKQGKVTVAVDIKSGDKATLDNESVLFLELYNDAKKRVDFRFVTLSELGLSNSLLGDHQVHRGLYRLGIDRNDAKYMTVKAHLMRNGDLYFTNFSARLSSIDDGAYEPNPDDLNQQILKQNTKIEQNSKEVAIKANSVDVTRDIKSAVDNVQVGGTNLLKNSVGPFQPHTDHPIDNYSEYHDSVVELVNGEQYTISGTTNGVFSQEHNPSQESDKCVLWLVDDAGINQIVSDENTAKGTTFTWNHPTKKYVLRVNTYHPGSTNQIKAWKIKIEKGNKATDWSPAPEDVSEEIKSAKDAAIQVASDQISIHVNEISTQFDDKLNKRINEQKTASEKFTTDGIEQTVTKITNVKNDVDRLGDKVNGISVGTSNLLHNSDTFDGWIRGASTNISGKYLNGSVAILGGAGVNGGQITTNLDGPNDNALLTWSVYAKADIAGDKFHTELWGGGGSTDQPLTTDWKLYKFSGRRNANHPDFYLWGIIGNKGNIYVSLPVAVIGNTIGSWTPNSEDINKKIDTQVLDSANINDMKTQGHYFVKSLTGNPLAGWVYVDVMGFDGRIRQDVYQDGDSKHMYRRLFGSNWSGWEQGAYISDVKTEVTASVKNLGDRVITQVNSVETRVNNKVDNLKAGGDNLIRNGDANAYNATPWENTHFQAHSFYYNGTRKMFNLNTSGKTELTSGSNWFPVVAGHQYTLYFNGFMSSNVSSYDVWLLGKKADSKTTFWDDTFQIVTGERLSPSKNCIVTKTFTVPNFWNNYVAYVRFDNNGSTDGQDSVFFFNEVSLKEGNINVGYSANPDDTIEAIKEVNTKWDVANGQIQGKVTETQVNNILNGKGYATQSWAETMFQMKKNSITLQAVRDNITNGIQNQVNSTNDRINDTNNRLNNLKIGGTNLLRGTSDTPRRLQGSGYLCKTTASDIYTSTADFHGGDQFTYSATITNNSNHPVSLEMWLFNGREKGHTASNINSHSEIVPAHTQNKRVSATITITSDTWWVRTYVIYSDGHGVDGETVDVSNEKLEVGNVATDWSPNPNDTGNGVNVLRGTADFSWPTGIGTNGTVNLGYEKFDATTIQLHVWGNNGGIYTKWGEAFPDGQIQVGEQYVFSFDIKGNGTFSSVKNESESLNIASGVPVTNTYQRVKVVGTIKSLDKAFIIYFQGDYDVRIKNVKIERGSKATPWTPHPFDDKDKGVNLLKSTAYWNPNDWNHISDGYWYDDNWTDNLGHKAYGRSNAAWNGLGQTVYVTPGVYTWSAQIYLNGLDSNDSVYPYMGDSQYNGTAQVQEIRRPMLGVNDQNRWIDYSTTFYVKNAGNLCVRPELNRDHGTIHVGSQKLEHGMVATPWSPSPLDDKNATITLNSADVNNMKTQGHYFVRNLANNPISGWVYVDVTGNNNDRLKQEVYQDNGYEHRSRRWTGSGWTEWTTDVNNKNVVSQINITPDQIKIASNKIVIDGNTDIHGDLRTDRVRLVGKNGAIDMTGDTGIKLTNNDGSSMLLERGNIDLMYKNDFRMNIDSSLMTIMQRNQFTGQNKPIAILNIGSSWNHSNNQIRGADIRYNPGNVNDVNLHGADYLALSYNKPNLTPGEANIKPQLVMAYQDLKFDENHYLWRKGVNVADDLTIQEYQRINVGYRDKEDQSGKWTNDPLMIHRMQWSNSYQADRYQPTIRLGYSKDSMGHAGVTFLWDQVKPFGDRDISDLGSIWFNGQRFVFGWASHKRMFGNQQQPAFMRLDDKGEIMSGIAFTPGSTWDLGSGAWNITASVMNNGG